MDFPTKYIQAHSRVTLAISTFENNCSLNTLVFHNEYNSYSHCTRKDGRFHGGLEIGLEFKHNSFNEHDKFSKCSFKPKKDTPVF